MRPSSKSYKSCLLEESDLKTTKLERLKAAGWKVGRTEDFLSLSDEEVQAVALKLSLIASGGRTHDIQAAFVVGN